MNLSSLIYIDRFPKLDLHGYDRDSAVLAINEYIEDNVKMQQAIVIIVHGIGSGILKQATHEALSKNKNVKAFSLVNQNIGCTAVEIII